MSRARPIEDLPDHRGSLYPEPFRSAIGDRVKRRLGDAFGLDQFGANHVTLGPGGMSALRHYHSHEDELVVVLSGTLVLVTDEGEQAISAGMCVGFRGGATDAHQLLNRSDAPATYLEIGTRTRADVAFYPDDDLCWLRDEAGRFYPAHKDGRPY